MKKLIVLSVTLFVLNTLQAQYSNYYRVDVNANVNKNVNVSGNINEYKTVRTIDYGALELAAAQKEKNRLENTKYENEQQRQIALEIASNPLKAYDYGYKPKLVIKKKATKRSGLKKYAMSYVIPHSSLFINAGAGRFENVSPDGITTEIIFSLPVYNKNKNWDIDFEKHAKMENMIVGQLNDNGDGNKIYVHKKDINRATVFGVKGFKSTLIWEDDYEYCITDNYRSYDATKKNGIGYFVKVRTYGSKKEVTFEAIEGRRYYLRQLVEKVISSASIYDIKYR